MVAKVSMVEEEKVAALQHSGDLYKCEWHGGDSYGDDLCLYKGSEWKKTESPIKRKRRSRRTRCSRLTRGK